MTQCISIFILQIILLTRNIVNIAGLPSVKTPLGTINGIYVYYNNETVSAFIGIPYIEPPIGNLRFQKPVPKKPWSVPINATTDNPLCVQAWPDYFGEMTNIKMDEDCVRLNIWTPVTIRKPVPVLFWIHSGGYTVGSNYEIEGRVLANEGHIIVVAPNHRIGPLGFASLGTNEIPGNMGLYDLLEALKWTHENIESFGGDKNQITISGQSSGSITGSIFVSSPLTKNLFNRLIMHSGCLGVYVPILPSRNYNRTISLAKRVGCYKSSTVDIKAIAECLRNVDAYLLMNTDKEMGKDRFAPQFGDDILPTDPRTSIKEGNFKSVELLIGTTKDEGGYKLISDALDFFGMFGEKQSAINETFGRELAKNFTDYVPRREWLMDYYFALIDDNTRIRRNTVCEIRAVYENLMKNKCPDEYLPSYDDIWISKKIVNQTYRIFGDLRYTCPSQYFAEKMAEKNNVYYFYFNYNPSYNEYEKWLGAAHGLDLRLVFGKPIIDPEIFNAKDIRLSRRMLEAWTNFVKTGVPYTAKFGSWPLYSKSSPLYMILDSSPKTKIGSGPNIKYCEFQRSLHGMS